MTRAQLVATWIAVSGLLVGAPSAAAVFPLAPGDDVQAALDHALPGDTVLLLEGTHSLRGPLVLRDGVALRGQSRDGAMLRGDGGDDAHLVFPGSITDERTQVSDLTVTGGSADRGGAILVDGAGAGAILRTRLHRNRATSAGSAIYIARGTVDDFRVAFNLIHHNGDPAILDVHAIDIDSARPLLHNNTIAYNDDNGIFVFSNAPGPRMANNIFARNGIDFDPPVVVDPDTLEPVSGVSDNVGRGICYFSRPAGDEPLISHNLFLGNERAALLVNGPFRGDYEDPRELEEVADFIVASVHQPRGSDDAVLFADGPGGDFRIQPLSGALFGGDPSFPPADGFPHIGAEGPALEPGCRVTGVARGPAGAWLQVRAGPDGGTLRARDGSGRFLEALEVRVEGCASLAGQPRGQRAVLTGRGRLDGSPELFFLAVISDPGPGARGRGATGEFVLRQVGSGGDVGLAAELTRGGLRIHDARAGR